MRLRVPTDEADLNDLLDRVLDKGLLCGIGNLMVLSDNDPAHSADRFRVSSVETNTGTYGKRKTSLRSPKSRP